MRSSLASFLILLVAAACSSKQQLPPGDALEVDEAEAGGPQSLAPPPPPDEQERKFAAELERRDDAAAAGAKQDEAKPAPKLTQQPAALRSKPFDTEIQARERAADALASAKKALARGDTAAVAEQLAQAEGVIEEAGPDAEQKFFELSFLLNLKTLEGELAEKAGWSWLRSCGPSSVDGCRAKALSALGKIPKPSAALHRRISAVKEHDACVKQAEGKRDGDKPPPCADSAAAFYKRDGDRLMVARLKLANAISNASKTPTPDHAAHQLEQAEKVCDEARCIGVRRSANKWLMRLHKAKDDLEGLVRVAISDNHLYAASLPPQKRLYARTPELESACAAFDKKMAATNACRRLERDIAGEYTFRDFSVKQQKGEGLSPDVVREVNAHYSVTLEGCLQDAAHRLTPPASETHGVRWTVSNDGRVTQVELQRKEADAGPLGQCLRAQFDVWRYPRYRGELQHVEQNFVVTARERR